MGAAPLYTSIWIVFGGRVCETCLGCIHNHVNACPSQITKLSDLAMPTTYVTHLECSKTGKSYPARQLHNLSDEGFPLWVRYDLERLANEITKQDVYDSPEQGFWRYVNFLPVENPAHRISLGEFRTPLIRLRNSITSLGGQSEKVHFKDESRLPTGSFKARGLALAVSMAKELGVKRLAIPTNGNAGAALAAYARRAGLEATVLCPDDTPEVNVREIQVQGASTWRVNGLINDCGTIVRGGVESVGWFDVSTLKEPYRIEGKKTMGLELAEQMNWRLPDVIFYPTGGGTGLIGMWKAFNELKQIGWIDGPLPRMVAVQSNTCAPIVEAWQEGKSSADFWPGASTIASGIRVPAAIGDFMILDAIRESDGFAISVADEEILWAQSHFAKSEGVLTCPEGAATAAAYRNALESGQVSSSDVAVLFNCATGLKYPLPPVSNRLDINRDVDYEALVAN